MKLITHLTTTTVIQCYWEKLLREHGSQNFKSYADTYVFSPLQINATWWTDPYKLCTYCCVKDMTQASEFAIK